MISSFLLLFYYGFYSFVGFFSFVRSFFLFICFCCNCSLLMMGRRSIFQACITYLCRYFFSAYTQSHTQRPTPAHKCCKTLNITRNVMNHTDFVSHSSGNNSLPWSGFFFSSSWILSRFIFFSFFFLFFLSIRCICFRNYDQKQNVSTVEISVFFISLVALSNCFDHFVFRFVSFFVLELFYSICFEEMV